jgi:hypothetical protein
MTLVTSLRIPDGVILSADSLQTTIGTIQPELKNFRAQAPKSREMFNIPSIKMPPINIPSSTSSFAQKLFPFKEKYGIAIFGSNVVNSRTIYNHIKVLENSIEEELTMTEVGDKMKEYFENEMKSQLKSIPNLNPNQTIFGIQIVGFKNGKDITGTTLEYNFGANTKFSEHKGIGCTVSGDNFIAMTLFQAQKKSPINFGAFSLQDGIDFTEFLTNTTSDYQRFANMIPTVGGNVDIALITEYSGFKWIKVKHLTKILES